MNKVPLYQASIDQARLLVRGREFFIDTIRVQIHFIIKMIRRTGLAP
jgi:hypothetical protein